MNQAAECVSNFKLEEWETVCNKCDGGGSFPKKFAKLEDPYYSICSKCQGEGKVDWIENIVGRKTNIFNFYDKCDVLAQQLANKIDQEIMGSLIKKSEQNNKMKAAAVLSEMGRCNF